MGIAWRPGSSCGVCGPDYFAKLRKRRERKSAVKRRKIAKQTHITPASAPPHTHFDRIKTDYRGGGPATVLTRRVLAARKNGREGGNQTTRFLTDVQREERARIGGNAVLNRYGRDYFSYLGKLGRNALRNPRIESALDGPPKVSNATRRLCLMAAATLARGI